MSKCCRDLQKIIHLSCQHHSFGHSTGQLPFLCPCVIGRTVKCSYPVNNHNYHILEACHVPSSVLSALHILFWHLQLFYEAGVIISICRKGNRLGEINLLQQLERARGVMWILVHLTPKSILLNLTLPVIGHIMYFIT